MIPIAYNRTLNTILMDKSAWWTLDLGTNKNEWTQSQGGENRLWDLPNKLQSLSARPNILSSLEGPVLRLRRREAVQSEAIHCH